MKNYDDKKLNERDRLRKRRPHQHTASDTAPSHLPAPINKIANDFQILTNNVFLKS